MSIRLINNRKLSKEEIQENIQKGLSSIDFQISNDPSIVVISEEQFLSILYFLIKENKLPPMTFNHFEGKWGNFKIHYYYNPEQEYIDVETYEKAVNNKIIDIDNFELVIDDQFHIFKNKTI